MTNTVSVQELKEWLGKNEAVLIDVREPAEYAAGHIAGAVLLPVGSITAAQLPDVGARKLVMQCKSGGRSQAACQKLANENPALAPYNLIGGITAWTAAGYEMEK